MGIPEEIYCDIYEEVYTDRWPWHPILYVHDMIDRKQRSGFVEGLLKFPKTFSDSLDKSTAGTLNN